MMTSVFDKNAAIHEVQINPLWPNLNKNLLCISFAFIVHHTLPCQPISSFARRAACLVVVFMSVACYVVSCAPTF